MQVESSRKQNEVVAQNVCHFGPWLDRNFRFVLMLILLLTLLPGAVILWWRLEYDPWQASDFWSQITLNVAHGQGYVGCRQSYFPFCGPDNQVTAAREPLPVLLFAALAKLTGGLQPVGMILEWILNLAILAGVFSITRELAGTRPALLAALMWALYVPAVRIFYPAIAGDALATLALTWALFFFLRATATSRSLHWLLSGACLGISALSRSSVVILIPVLAIYALVQQRAGINPPPSPSRRSFGPRCCS
jgi:asparagine N-glycosylation enzyme membrane subunit Stt3